MQTDNFEIINLNPNINYDSSDEEEEDTVMEIIPQDDNDSIQSNSNDTEVKIRKKLNLEEYKQKRANQPAPKFTTTGSTTLELCEIIPDTLPPIPLPSDPRAIKKFLSQVKDSKSESDNGEECCEIEQIPSLHPDYEEIIRVSIQCNTDISISPHDQHEQLLSSANFFTNIVNNEKLVNSSANSLFSSINEVLQKKCESQQIDQVVVNDKLEQHHGEDKVIMHLRKDRIRPSRNSIAIQSEVSPLFPPLILSPMLIFNRIRNVRNYRRKSRSRSRSRSRSLSPESSEYYTGGSYYNFNNNPFIPRSHNSAYSSSMNSSELDTNSSDSDDSSAYSSARSSDQGSIKRFENTYRHYRQQKYRDDGNGNKIQEERKIVYVGEILKETTKEELRRKFIKYGTIKKISLHAREDGSLRYGFVTFAESSVAYEVLDKFVTDPALCNYDIRFGGRRKFCKQTYADLDNEIDADGNKVSNNNEKSVKSKELSFEDLLNMAKRKLQTAKK